MKLFSNSQIEAGRIKTGKLQSSSKNGMNGAFRLEYPNEFGYLAVIASDGMGWDHVSVSTPERCPTWDEMKWVKELFFKDDEAAFQIYPPKSLYRNCHPYCLHWWRPQHQEITLPLPLMIAP